MMLMTIVFLFNSSTVFCQHKYPRQFKKARNFALLSQSDTFDCNMRHIILSKDSIFQEIDGSGYGRSVEKGTYSLLSQHMLVLHKEDHEDTVDILTLQKQVVLMPHRRREDFIKRLKDGKRFYRKNRMNMKHSFRWTLVANLMADHYAYSRRNEIRDWSIDQARKKKKKS